MYEDVNNFSDSELKEKSEMITFLGRVLITFMIISFLELIMIGYLIIF